MYRYLILGLIIIITACSEPDNNNIPSNNTEKAGPSDTATPTATTRPSSDKSDNTKRFALVIGNADYKNVLSLDNPVNDANDMKAVLEKLGFVVMLGRNLKRREMVKMAQEFGQRLQKADIGLFYFSGHGLQSQQRNYLVPVDAQIHSEADIEFESVNAGRILAQMEQANNGVNIVILDACQDNPYESSALKSLTKGLAEMTSPTGTLIAYGTAPNKASYSDSEQRNSIYTKYLLKALREKPYMSALDMLTEVTQQVVAETQGLQVPWKADSLTHRFCFGKCGQLPQPPRPDVSPLLRVCETHFQANRLTSGRGGTALACYEDVLKKDPTNAEALAGLAKIEARYVEWAEKALRHGKPDKAKRYLASLRQVNPESLKLAELEAQLQPQPRITVTPPPNTPPPSTGNRFVAGKVFQDRLRDGGVGPEMVWIAAGRFKMGDIQGGGDSDEQPVHWVSLNKFAIGKYEVTVGEYLRFVKATGNHAPEWLEAGSQYHIKTGTDDYYKKYGSALTNENHPIVGISWHDATAYAKWLSQQTGQQYRLPTEAEWEYAARAGTTTKYWWGNQIGSNNANCLNKYCRDSFKYTAPVGSFAPNSFGLYDTAGNVWEWTCSEYEDKYTGKEQRCVKNAGRFAVRGGSWGDGARGVRSAYRYRVAPSGRIDFRGVRLVRQ
jgi:formylglycine-generating enzyme required for sulfatase activity